VRVVGDVGGACAGIGLVSSACGGGGRKKRGGNKVVCLGGLGDRETDEAWMAQETGADGGHWMDCQTSSAVLRGLD